MERFRINITDNLAWGNLVKSWATGRNYVDYKPTEDAPLPPDAPGNAPKYPRPTSFKDFATQATAAKAGLVFEDGHDTPVTGDEGLGFLLVQGTLDMFVLKLPATEALERSEQQLITAGETYLLPPFYARIFETEVKDNEVATKVQRMTLHAERIGEYTMNTCH